MLFWRRLENVSLTDLEKNILLLCTKEERNILRISETHRRKANWIAHIPRGNWLLKYVMEGRIEERVEMTGRRGRRSKHLQFYFKEKTGCRKLKEGARDRNLEDLLCTRQLICRKMMCVMNEDRLEYYTVCAELYV